MENDKGVAIFVGYSKIVNVSWLVNNLGSGDMETRKQELLEMIEALDTKNEMNYIEGAFRFFVDNQVSDKELDFILKEKGEVLPDEFFDLSIREKKTYYTHTKTSVRVKDNTYAFARYEVFNKQYFYRLAEAAKKNQEITRMLIDYVSEVGYDWNLLFMCAQHIKLSKIKPMYFSAAINKYRSDNPKVYTVYDLVMAAFSEWEKKEGIKQLRKDVFALLNKSTFLNVNVDHPFFQFILLMECVLNELPRKEANTLKVKFLILTPEELRDIDYYSDDAHQKRIINTCKSKLQESKLLQQVRKLIKNNKQLYDDIGPNGYSALYNFLLAE